MIYDFKKPVAGQNRPRNKGLTSLFSNFQKLNFYYLALFVLFLSILNLLSIRITFTTKEKDFQAMLIARQKLEAEILPMQLEEQYLTRLEVVEEIAQKDLGLSPPKKSQIKRIIVNPD